jgi:hypothetical protein
MVVDFSGNTLLHDLRAVSVMLYAVMYKDVKIDLEYLSHQIDQNVSCITGIDSWMIEKEFFSLLPLSTPVLRPTQLHRSYIRVSLSDIRPYLRAMLTIHVS